eukprot:m.218674 g.218674  ORF g.218674 m.218674 type:complete len:363 (+) comp39903_c0_seq1:196-1284(+)
MSTSTLFVGDTEQTADSVEWCPIWPYDCLFACATYQLEEKAGSGISGNGGGDSTKNVRVGSLFLYKAAVETAPSSVSILKLQRIGLTAGILDMKWSPVRVEGKVRLAAALSDGQIKIFHIKDVEDDAIGGSVLLEVGCHCSVSEGICLSLDWEMALDKQVLLVVSDSLSQLSILRYTGSTLEPYVNWKGHDFEAWIATFDFTDKNVVYSGSDDCTLKLWDIRDLSRPQRRQVLKEHSMGVCSIRSNHLRAHCLATGSYDEMVLVWDTRHMVRPTTKTETGGGVWRLKWHPRKESSLLSACMHNGFHIIECSTGKSSVCVSYKEHKSLAYGADWSHMEWCGNDLIATCSFYDHQLRVWSTGLG